MGKQVKKIAEELGISTRQVSRDKNSALAKMLKRMKAAGYESYAEASGAFQQESDYIPTQMETQNSIMKKRTGEVRVPSDNKAKIRWINYQLWVNKVVETTAYYKG